MKKLLILEDFLSPQALQTTWEIYHHVMSLPIPDPAMDDARRAIHELNNGEEDWSIQAFHIKSDVGPLGKHAHDAKDVEVFVILEGKLELLLTAHIGSLHDPGQWERHEHLGPGAVIVIPRLVAHTFYLAPGSRMIAFSSGRFDKFDFLRVPKLVAEQLTATQTA